MHGVVSGPDVDNLILVPTTILRSEQMSGLKYLQKHSGLLKTLEVLRHGYTIYIYIYMRVCVRAPYICIVNACICL